MAYYKLNNNGDQIQAALDKINNLFNLVYPVGSIYMSVNNTNPGILFGGTWTQIQDRFLLAAGTYSGGDTGGNATHTHTMAHTHTEGDLAAAIGASGNSSLVISYQAGSVNSRGPSTVTSYTVTGASSSSSSRSFNHHTRVYGTTSDASTSTTSSTSNLPPYLVVYIWKRTA